MRVTTSQWPGLFYRNAIPNLQHTNDDLEHCFGMARHTERRVTGWKSASPSLVARCAVHVVVALATRCHIFTAAADLRLTLFAAPTWKECCITRGSARDVAACEGVANALRDLI